MAGIDRYRTLLAHHPGLGWLAFDGGLRWLREEESAESAERHRYEVAHGYDSHLLGADEIAAAVRGVNPEAVPAAGAVWNPGEGWVDLPSLVQFLVREFIGSGGTLVSDAGRCTVEVGAGRVTGVRTQDGAFLEADAVVLATGAAAPGMAAELGIPVPDATPLSFLVTTKPVRTELRAVLNTPRASLRPTPHGALAIDADWTTASITDRGDGTYQVPPDIVESLLAEAAAVLVGEPALEVAEVAAGPKPIPGDGDPVLGRVDTLDGLYLAFTHSGATLGLIAGELLAYEVTSGAPHPMLADFNVRRFGNDATVI